MADLQDVLGSDWVVQQRAEGGAILVMGLSGRIHHADDDVSRLLERDELPSNAFEMIAPGHALQASGMVVKYVGRPVVGWFPMTDGRSRPVWCRFHVQWPRGLLALALWKETDPARCKVHAEPLD